MADAALNKGEAPKGAENFSATKPAAEASKPVGKTESDIVGKLVEMGGEKTTNPDRLLQFMAAGGGESTLAGEKNRMQTETNPNVVDLRADTSMRNITLADKMILTGGEPPAADAPYQAKKPDAVDITPTALVVPETPPPAAQQAEQSTAEKPAALTTTAETPAKAVNDNEQPDPNKETKDQKMQRLSQELSDNRRKYVEATRWFGSSTASGEINKDDAERAYKDSLKSYREAKMADVQEQIASDPSLKEKPEGSDKSGADKLIEDTLREFTIGEFLELQNDDAEIRLQKRIETFGETGAKAIDWFKSKLESYRKMKTWQKIGLSVTANILTGGSASIVLRGLGIAASSGAYKEMMEGKAESMRNARWEEENAEGLNEAKTESGLDLSKAMEFLNKQSDGMADKFRSYKNMRFARTVGSIGAAVGISAVGSWAMGEFMQTDTGQAVKDKMADAADWAKGTVSMDAHAADSAQGIPDGADKFPTPLPRPENLAADTSGADSAPIAANDELGKLADIRYDVHKGDSIWKIIDRGIGDQMAEGGKQIYAIDTIKDRLANMTPDELRAIGISSGDINKLAIGDKLDLTAIFGENNSIMNQAIEDASGIPDSVSDSIERNISDHTPSYGSNSEPGHNFDTSPEHRQIKFSKSVMDFASRAIDSPLGQDASIRPGESESDYLSRVSNLAIARGIEIQHGPTGSIFNLDKTQRAGLLPDSFVDFATNVDGSRGGVTSGGIEDRANRFLERAGIDVRDVPPQQTEPPIADPNSESNGWKIKTETNTPDENGGWKIINSDETTDS